MMKKSENPSQKPDSLFRFRTVNPNSLSELANSELWFSDVSQFNDPFEFSFRITEELEFSQQSKKGIFRNLSPEKYNRIVNGWNHYQAKTKLAKLWMNTVGVCCFFDTNQRILAWSHYADSHKGFCVEFSSKDELFRTAKLVKYSDNRPDASFLVNEILQRYKGQEKELEDLLNRANPASLKDLKGEFRQAEFETTKESIQEIMTTKGKEWSYEESEWRVFNTKPNSLEDYGQNSVKAIYFGAKMTLKEKFLIQNVTQNSCEYFDCRIDEDRYQINFLPFGE